MKRFHPVPLGLIAIAGVCLLGPPASASDGVIELSQTCAVQTGCLPGDSKGFPISISESGSYVLTSDLEVSNANTGAISIFADTVSIELNGFAIRGITSCSGSPKMCSPSGTGIGIDAISSHTSVRNGVVEKMGSSGISVGTQGHIENVRTRENGGSGISTGPGSLVMGSSAVDNLLEGIKLLGGVARANAARANGGDGIQFGSAGGVVAGNQSLANNGDGIECVGTCNIHDNSAQENLQHGIRCGTSAGGYSIQRNTANENTQDGINCDVGGNVFQGNTTADNGGDGIDSFSSLYVGNTSASNTGFGIRGGAAGRDGASENVLVLNSGGAATGLITIGCNMIDAIRICPP